MFEREVSASCGSVRKPVEKVLSRENLALCLCCVGVEGQASLFEWRSLTALRSSTLFFQRGLCAVSHVAILYSHAYPAGASHQVGQGERT